MKVKKSQLIGSIAAFLASLAVLITAVSVNLAQQNDRLSEAQIEALREKYPVCGKSPPLVELAFPTLMEVKEYSETFVYGTVEGKPHVVSSFLYGGFSHCAFSVISDTAGVLQTGDTLDLVANISLTDYNPPFADGMKLVIPVSPMKGEEGQYSYNVCGTYYVTDDGYAVSAFDENKAQMKKSMSGVRVEKLLEELKK